MLDNVTESLRNFVTSDNDHEKQTQEELESSNPTADSILNRMPDLSMDSFRPNRHRRPNGSKPLTPGRRKSLREEGWDGIQGTHKEQKYVKLRRIQQRKEEAQRQAKSHSGDREETFEELAEDLRKREIRQKEKILQAEA